MFPVVCTQDDAVQAVSQNSVDDEQQTVQKIGKLPSFLRFCSRHIASRFVTLYKRGIIDAEGNLKSPYSALALPELTPEERQMFQTTVFKSLHFFKALQELATGPLKDVNGDTLSASIKGYVCIGSTLPYLLFGLCPKKGQTHPPFLKRCLAFVNSEDLYSEEIEEHYIQTPPSDLDIRATIETLTPLGGVKKNEVYQAVRSRLNSKALFRPGIEGTNNQFAVIQVKLPGVREKIDFIVSFVSTRKCVFNLDALAISLTPTKTCKKEFQVKLMSYIQNPMQAVIDHLLGFVRVANQGVTPVDERGWYKLVSCIVKGRLSGTKGQEQVLWASVDTEYLKNPKKGLKAFGKGLGHWLHTHHKGNASSAFIYLLNVLQLSGSRLGNDQCNQLIGQCKKWNRFKKLISSKETGLIAAMARVLFDSRFFIKTLFSVLQVVAYLLDSKKAKEGQKIKVERFYHEFTDPVYKLWIDKSVMMLPYDPIRALDVLMLYYQQNPKEWEGFAANLTPHFLELFPLGSFWKMRESTRRQITYIVDLKKVDVGAQALLNTSSPFLVYLGLLTIFVNSSSVSEKRKFELLLEFLPQLVLLSEEALHIDPLLETVRKKLSPTVKLEVFKRAVCDPDPCRWMEFLVSCRHIGPDLKKVAFVLWKKNISSNLQEKTYLFSLDLVKALVKSHPDEVFFILSALKGVPWFKTHKQKTFAALLGILSHVKNERHLLLCGRALMHLIDESTLSVSLRQTEELCEIAISLAPLDPQVALAILKYIPSKASRQYAKALYMVLLALSDRQDLVEIFSLYQKLLCPLADFCLHDDLFYLLKKMAHPPLLNIVTDEIKGLRCESHEIQQQRSLFLLSCAEKQFEKGELDENLVQCLRDEEKLVLRQSLLKKALDQKDFESAASILLILLNDKRPLNKSLLPAFKTILINARHLTAFALVKVALKNGQLNLIRSASFVIYLAKRDLENSSPDLELVDLLLDTLTKIDFLSLSKREIMEGVKVCLDLLEHHPLIDRSILLSRKQAFEKAFPKFFPFLKKELRKQVVFAIYKSGLVVNKTPENALFWFSVLETVQDPHKRYNLLVAAEKNGLKTFAKVFSKVIAIKCRLVESFCQNEATLPLALTLFDELILLAGENEEGGLISQTFKAVISILQKKSMHQTLIRLVNRWHAEVHQLSAPVIEVLLSSLWSVSESDEIFDLLVSSKVLQGPRCVKQSMELTLNLVQKVLTNLCEHSEEHSEKLASLFFSYLPLFLSKDKAYFSEKIQYIIFFSISSLCNKKDPRILLILNSPLFVSAFQNEELRIKTIVAIVVKSLEYSCNEDKRFEILKLCGFLIEQEKKRNLRAYKIEGHPEWRDEEIEYSIASRYVPLYLIEIQWISIFFVSKRVSVIREGHRQLAAWLKHKHSRVEWQCTGPLINQLMVCSFPPPFSQVLIFLKKIPKMDIGCIDIIAVLQFLVKQNTQDALVEGSRVLEFYLKTHAYELKDVLAAASEMLIRALFKEGSSRSMDQVEFLLPYLKNLYSQLEDKYGAFSSRVVSWMLELGCHNLKSMHPLHVKQILAAVQMNLKPALFFPHYEELVRNFANFLAKVAMGDIIYFRPFLNYFMFFWNTVRCKVIGMPNSSKVDLGEHKIYLITQVLKELKISHPNSTFALSYMAFRIALIKKEYAFRKHKMKPLIDLFKKTAKTLNFKLCIRTLDTFFSQDQLFETFQDLSNHTKEKNVKKVKNQVTKLLCSENVSKFLAGVEVYGHAEDYFLSSGFHHFLEMYEILTKCCIRVYPTSIDTCSVIDRVNQVSFPSWQGYDVTKTNLLQKIIPYARSRLFNVFFTQLCGVKMIKGTSLVFFQLPSTDLSAIELSLLRGLMKMTQKNIAEKLYFAYPVHLLAQIVSLIPSMAKMHKSSELKTGSKYGGRLMLGSNFQAHYKDFQSENKKINHQMKHASELIDFLFFYQMGKNTQKFSITMDQAKALILELNQLVQIQSKELEKEMQKLKGTKAQMHPRTESSDSS